MSTSNPRKNPATGDRPRLVAERLLRPRSVLVTGVSERPGTLGQRVLGELLKSGYKGDVYAYGRNAATVFDIEVITEFDKLPKEIDLALYGIPAAGIFDAVRDSIAHGVGTAVCYASGFAEQGEEGRRQEAELGRQAREGGLGLVGPNCFGFFNNVDGFSAMLAPIPPLPAPGPEVGPGVGVVAQSGSIGAYIAQSLGARNVPVSYLVTTGNEIGLGIPDLIEFFATDENTGAITLYAEQIRDPQRFIAAVRTAAAAGKPVVILHPGRSARAQAALASHTGALAGDHAIVTVMSRRAGAAVVETLEELIDVSQLLLRFPQPPRHGTAVVTSSGAICAVANDAADALGLELSELTPGIGPELDEALTFTHVSNPLDLGTQPITQPEILRLATKCILDDPAVGSIVFSIPHGADYFSVPWVENVIAGAAGSSKPFIYVIQSEELPSPAFLERVKKSRTILLQSPERALRTIARATEFGRARATGRVEASTSIELPEFTPGPQPEWLGKQALAVAGLPIPEGGLATTVDQAIEIAARIGYPVVAKAQAAKLAHKSDVGGVILNIRDEAGLRQAWQSLYDTIKAARPDLTLDGVLVEQMSPRGVELVIGARRDPRWGVVLLIGLGGVLVEVLKDVRLIPADLPVDAIAEEISRLKGAKLLHGYRGSDPVDINAVAAAVAAVGQLVAADPKIVEVDVNPLVAYPSGVIALDALIVTGQ